MNINTFQCVNSTCRITLSIVNMRNMVENYNVVTIILRKFFLICESICSKLCALRLSGLNYNLMQVSNLEYNAQFS